MARLGLLGAIGGLGQGLQTVGLDIAKRRERALEDAKELAKEQARAQERATARSEDQSFRKEMFTEGQNRQDARQTEAQAGQTGRQEAGFKHQDTAAAKRFQEQRALAQYRSNLALGNSQALAKFNEKLKSDDIVGIGPGTTTKDGYTNVIGRRRDGSLVPTGQQVKKEFFMSKSRPKTMDDSMSLTPGDTGAADDTGTDETENDMTPEEQDPYGVGAY